MPDFEDPQDWSKRPHVVLVVDESGSMQISRETTVSAINDYVGGLKGTLPAEARVTIVKFTSGYGFAPAARAGVLLNQPLSNTQITTLFDKVPLGEVRQLTLADFSPTGGTPLYDAVGRTMTDIISLVQAEPAPVYFGIVTDGEENSSVEFKLDTIKTMIERQKELGWTVTFLGVDIDAYAAGRGFGISADSTVSLSRGTMHGALKTFSGKIGERYAASAAFAASGEAMSTYADWSSKTAVFTKEDKDDLEKK